jgi:hypothetical protein
MMDTNVPQPTEQCRMTLKNGKRCRNRAKHSGLCGGHWHALISNRSKLTRREWLEVAAHVAQVVGTGVLIFDHVRPKPTATAVEIRVGDKSKVTGSLSVKITGVATVTASGTVTVQPASLDAAGFASTVVAVPPIELRRALWHMRVHPKGLAEVPAGRLRWNQLRFPKARDKFAI